MTELLQAPACLKCGGTDMVWRKDSSHRLGGRWRCKPCSDAYNKAYYVNRREDPKGPWVRQIERYRSDEEYREQIKEKNRQWGKANREHLRAYNSQPERRESNRRVTRDINLRVNYGITLNQYEGLHSAQGGRCALCGSESSANKRHEALCVDHCHDSGSIRGLLCKPCNTGLGCFRDSPELMTKAIQYLLNNGNRSLVDAVLHSVDERHRDGAA